MTKINDKNIEKARKQMNDSMPKRFTISATLLNDALGILSILPAFQIMELVTRIQMDLGAVNDDGTVTPVKAMMMDPEVKEEAPKTEKPAK